MASYWLLLILICSWAFVKISTAAENNKDSGCRVCGCGCRNRNQLKMKTKTKLGPLFYDRQTIQRDSAGEERPARLDRFHSGMVNAPPEVDCATANINRYSSDRISSGSEKRTELPTRNRYTHSDYCRLCVAKKHLKITTNKYRISDTTTSYRNDEKENYERYLRKLLEIYGKSQNRNKVKNGNFYSINNYTLTNGLLKLVEKTDRRLTKANRLTMDTFGKSRPTDVVDKHENVMGMTWDGLLVTDRGIEKSTFENDRQNIVHVERKRFRHPPMDRYLKRYETTQYYIHYKFGPIAEVENILLNQVQIESTTSIRSTTQRSTSTIDQPEYRSSNYETTHFYIHYKFGPIAEVGNVLVNQVQIESTTSIKAADIRSTTQRSTSTIDQPEYRSSKIESTTSIKAADIRSTTQRSTSPIDQLEYRLSKIESTTSMKAADIRSTTQRSTSPIDQPEYRLSKIESTTSMKAADIRSTTQRSTSPIDQLEYRLSKIESTTSIRSTSTIDQPEYRSSKIESTTLMKAADIRSTTQRSTSTIDQPEYRSSNTLNNSRTSETIGTMSRSSPSGQELNLLLKGLEEMQPYSVDTRPPQYYNRLYTVFDRQPSIRWNGAPRSLILPSFQLNIDFIEKLLQQKNLELSKFKKQKITLNTRLAVTNDFNHPLTFPDFTYSREEPVFSTSASSPYSTRFTNNTLTIPIENSTSSKATLTIPSEYSTSSKTAPTIPSEYPANYEATLSIPSEYFTNYDATLIMLHENSTSTKPTVIIPFETSTSSKATFTIPSEYSTSSKTAPTIPSEYSANYDATLAIPSEYFTNYDATLIMLHENSTSTKPTVIIPFETSTSSKAIFTIPSEYSTSSKTASTIPSEYSENYEATLAIPSEYFTNYDATLIMLLENSTSSKPTVIIPFETSTSSKATFTIPSEYSTSSTAALTIPSEYSENYEATLAIPPEFFRNYDATFIMLLENSTSSKATFTIPSEYSTSSKAALTIPSEYSAIYEATFTIPCEYSTNYVATVTIPSEYSTSSKATITIPSDNSTSSKATVTIPSEYSTTSKATITIPSDNSTSSKTTVTISSDNSTSSKTTVTIQFENSTSSKAVVTIPSEYFANYEATVRIPSECSSEASYTGFMSSSYECVRPSMRKTDRGRVPIVRTSSTAAITSSKELPLTIVTKMNMTKSSYGLSSMDITPMAVNMNTSVKDSNQVSGVPVPLRSTLLILTASTTVPVPLRSTSPILTASTTRITLNNRPVTTLKKLVTCKVTPMTDETTTNPTTTTTTTTTMKTTTTTTKIKTTDENGEEEETEETLKPRCRTTKGVIHKYTAITPDICLIKRSTSYNATCEILYKHIDFPVPELSLKYFGLYGNEIKPVDPNFLLPAFKYRNLSFEPNRVLTRETVTLQLCSMTTARTMVEETEPTQFPFIHFPRIQKLMPSFQSKPLKKIPPKRNRYVNRTSTLGLKRRRKRRRRETVKESGPYFMFDKDEYETGRRLLFANEAVKSMDRSVRDGTSTAAPDCHYSVTDIPLVRIAESVSFLPPYSLLDRYSGFLSPHPVNLNRSDATVSPITVSSSSLLDSAVNTRIVFLPLSSDVPMPLDIITDTKKGQMNTSESKFNFTSGLFQLGSLPTANIFNFPSVLSSNLTDTKKGQMSTSQSKFNFTSGLFQLGSLPTANMFNVPPLVALQWSLLSNDAIASTFTPTQISHFVRPKSDTSSSSSLFNNNSAWRRDSRPTVPLVYTGSKVALDLTSTSIECSTPQTVVETITPTLDNVSVPNDNSPQSSMSIVRTKVDSPVTNSETASRVMFASPNCVSKFKVKTHFALTSLQPDCTTTAEDTTLDSSPTSGGTLTHSLAPNLDQIVAFIPTDSVSVIQPNDISKSSNPSVSDSESPRNSGDFSEETNGDLDPVTILPDSILVPPILLDISNRILSKSNRITIDTTKTTRFDNPLDRSVGNSYTQITEQADTRKYEENLYRFLSITSSGRSETKMKKTTGSKKHRNFSRMNKSNCERYNKHCVCWSNQMVKDIEAIILRNKDPDDSAEDISNYDCTAYVPVPDVYNLTELNVNVNGRQRSDKNLNSNRRTIIRVYSMNESESNLTAATQRKRSDSQDPVIAYNGSVIRAFPHASVEIPCFNSNEFMLFSDVDDTASYSWHYDNTKAVSEKRIAEDVSRRGTLQISDVQVEDSGRYVCSVYYIDPDTYRPVSDNFSHILSVVMAPEMSVLARLHYITNYDSGCSPENVAALMVGLPLKIEQTICTLTGDTDLTVCSVDVHNPLCHSVHKRCKEESSGGGRCRVRKGFGSGVEKRKRAVREVLSFLFSVSVPDLREPIKLARDNRLCSPECGGNIVRRMVTHITDCLNQVLSIPVKIMDKASMNAVKYLPDRSSISLKVTGGCIGGFQMNGRFCEPCQPGHYSNEESGGKCKQCPPGYKQTAIAAKTCEKCTFPWTPGCTSMAVWSWPLVATAASVGILFLVIAYFSLCCLYVVCVHKTQTGSTSQSKGCLCCSLSERERDGEQQRKRSRLCGWSLCCGRRALTKSSEENNTAVSSHSPGVLHCQQGQPTLRMKNGLEETYSGDGDCYDLRWAAVTATEYPPHQQHLRYLMKYPKVLPTDSDLNLTDDAQLPSTLRRNNALRLKCAKEETHQPNTPPVDFWASSLQNERL